MSKKVTSVMVSTHGTVVPLAKFLSIFLSAFVLEFKVSLFVPQPE